MNRLLKSSLAVASLLLAASAASASTTTTIDFNGISAANNSVFTSYTEGGYTVAAVSGDPFVATSGFGDPVPDIFSNAGAATISVTSGNYFTFDSVDLANYGYISGDTYTIEGFDVTATAFDYSGTITGVGTFSQYSNAFSADNITKLEITIDGTNSTNLDNIVVGPATSVAVSPEPSSLVLLGTGLIGAAGAARRRFTRR